MLRHVVAPNNRSYLALEEAFVIISNNFIMLLNKTCSVLITLENGSPEKEVIQVSTDSELKESVDGFTPACPTSNSPVVISIGKTIVVYILAIFNREEELMVILESHEVSRIL